MDVTLKTDDLTFSIINILRKVRITYIN